MSGLQGRWQTAALVALVVTSLVIVAFALRPPPVISDPVGRPTFSTAPSPTATSASSSASSPSPSPSASENGFPAGTKVAFIGDSFAAGAGASAPAQRWTSLLSSANDWVELNVAHAQTGYLRAGSLGACTPQVCRPFTEEVPGVVAAKPALVILTGGANDLGRDAQSVRVSAAKTIGDLRVGLPEAKIVVVNPWWDLRPVNPQLAELTDLLKAEAAAAGAIWIDTDQPLQNAALMQGDGVQPNDAGHLALATAVGKGLRDAGFSLATP